MWVARVPWEVDGFFSLKPEFSKWRRNNYKAATWLLCIWCLCVKLLTFIRIKWVQTSTKTCKLKEQKRELWNLKHYSQNLSFTVPQFNILLWVEWRTFALSYTLKWEVCQRSGKDCVCTSPMTAIGVSPLACATLCSIK